MTLWNPFECPVWSSIELHKKSTSLGVERETITKHPQSSVKVLLVLLVLHLLSLVGTLV